MNIGSNLLYIWTKDNLRLPGVHYLPQTGSINTCLLFIHGMSGNILENYFAHVLGNILANNGMGMIYGHNRGYNHINDILKKKTGIISKRNDTESIYTTERYGAIYERFNDCILDIDAWLEECRKLGYKKIILLGHSLGANKVIHYFSQKQPKDVEGVILASPPDMVGLFEKSEYQPNHQKLQEEARKNIKEGNPRKIVSEMIWDWYNLSSQTYLDLSEQEGPADNLPILRNPKKFEELATINVPILGIMGEYDDIVIRSLKKDLELIASKTVNSPVFTKKFIKGANHVYDTKEEDFAEVILEWVKSLVKK